MEIGLVDDAVVAENQRIIDMIDAILNPPTAIEKIERPKRRSLSSYLIELRSRSGRGSDREVVEIHCPWYIHNRCE
jgi:hypothetical protein